MNNPNILSDPKKMLEEEYKLYREIYSGVIKENFLIEILSKVNEDFEYIALVNSDTNRYLDIGSLLLKNNNLNALLCKMIVMAHYMNVFTLDDTERGRQQKSVEYKNKLVKEVVGMFKFARLVTPELSETSLESFYPCTYYLVALNNYCFDAVSFFIPTKYL